jgi:hypothetical protein
VRNDEGTMDVRKQARSEAINTGTDSTARVTKGSGSRDKCLYSSLKPWGVFTSRPRCESNQLRNLLYTTDAHGGAEPTDTFENAVVPYDVESGAICTPRKKGC